MTSQWHNQVHDKMFDLHWSYCSLLPAAASSYWYDLAIQTEWEKRKMDKKEEHRMRLYACVWGREGRERETERERKEEGGERRERESEREEREKREREREKQQQQQEKTKKKTRSDNCKCKKKAELLSLVGKRPQIMFYTNSKRKKNESALTVIH